MRKPLHVLAFEHFYKASGNHLEAMIAFSLFMDSEHKWAVGCKQWPDDQEYQNYHGIYLTQHETAGYIEAAQRVLQQFGTELIDQERKAFLEAALADSNQSAEKGHKKFRWMGVWEAMFGAFFGRFS